MAEGVRVMPGGAVATAGRPRCHGGEADSAAGRPSSAVPMPRVMTRPRQTLISPYSACPLAVLRPRLDSGAWIVILPGERATGYSAPAHLRRPAR